MFSNPKHVLCTNEIIRLCSQLWWLPKALKLSSIMYFIRAPSSPWSEMYTFSVYTWYWRFIYANILIQYSYKKAQNCSWFLKKKINCPASARRKCFGKMTQPFCLETTLQELPRTSLWEPSWNARGLREGDVFLQNETEAERREKVSKPREVWRFQEGLKMDVEGRDGQVERWGGDCTRVRERFGLGNTFLDMCSFKPGVANSAACRVRSGGK